VFGVNLNYFDLADHQSVLSTSVGDNGIDVVFIGGTSGDFREVAKIAATLKQIKPDLVVVVGGYLVSTEPELVISNMEADFGIIGLGESTSVELLDALGNNFSKSACSAIEGLIFIDEYQQLVKTPARKVCSFDFSRIPNLQLLFDADIKRNKQIDLVGSIGCPFSCTFCSRPVGTKKYDQRPLDSLFNELDYWLRIYDIKTIGINDELFSLNEDRVREFCSRISHYHIGFGLQGRVDTITEEMLALLKDAGCHAISYGLESANNSILSSMNKGITIEQIQKTLSATRSHDISIIGNFIFGDIQETYETANDTLDWWISNMSKYDIHLTMIVPFPGSHVYDYAVQKGIIPDKLQFLKDGCPPVNLSKMSDSEMLRLRRKIDNLLQIKSKASNVSITAIDSDNTVNLNIECGHCFDEFTVCNKDLGNDSRWSYDRCPKCGGHNLISPNDIYKPYLYKQVLDDIAENYFKDFVSNNKKIAMWGAKERGQLLIASSPSLRKCLIKVVDNAYQSFEGKLLGLIPVDPPESLKDIEFDCLIIASTNYREEIRLIVLDDFKLNIEILYL
jgi:anaerobic magnesium-protoporphyrin IX monomethyl ester cyclase